MQACDHMRAHRFAGQEIEFMSTRVRYSKALDGTDYIPGCIGHALGMTVTSPQQPLQL